MKEARRLRPDLASGEAGAGRPLAVAIDGPAGAGKSTVAKGVAKRLGIIYVDTGAMYRALALHCMEQGVDLEDGEALAKALDRSGIRLEHGSDGQRVFLGERDVTEEIRREDVGNNASRVSVHPDVREKMVEMQQRIAGSQAVVMDGRDIGTHVLPDATLKVYLTASSLVRAQRRHLELQAKGMERRLDLLVEEIEERDRRDMEREHAPLRQAEDAVLLDASDLDAEQVVERVLSLLERVEA
ncbi:(d)CMP kinase [Anaerotalea alkaliphila]|nr:(d)CMP kinase [Anaerotalea alkaliphila]